MRTTSEIRDTLVSALNGSVNWRKLKNSLIGKELIYFGVNVIQQADLVAGALINAFDYKTADKRSLISLSHSLDTAVSFINPAYIRVRISGSDVYRPFDITYSIGGINFYNIEYVKAGTDIVLYQGVVKNINQSEENISGFQVSSSEVWEDVEIYNESTLPITGVKLGEALPESVYAFYKNKTTEMLSPYTPLRSGPDAQLFKLYTLQDETQLIVFGDGTWGRSEYPNCKFQLVYLKPTAQPFELNGKLTTRGTEVTGYTILGSGPGAVDDLEYARAVFSKWHLQNVALASKSRIQEYVNSFPYIQDSEVDALNNSITVYVKPTDPDDTGDFDSIAADLDIYGTLFTNNVVRSGTPLLFKFLIEGKTNKKSEIEDFLKVHFAYENLSYGARVNLAKVAAELQLQFGETFNVLFHATARPISGEYLKFLPMEKTVKLLDTQGNLVGYDSNGTLLGKVDDPGYEIIEDNLQFTCINELFFYEDEGVATPAILNMNAVIRSYNSMEVTKLPEVRGDYAYFYSTEKYGDGSAATLTVYRLSQFTVQGWVDNPLAVTKARLVGTSGNPYNVSGTPFYHNNILYFINSSAEKNIELTMTSVYSTENGNLLQTIYPIVIPFTGVVRSVIMQGSNLYLFLDNSVCIEVINFSKSDYSFQALEVVDDQITNLLILNSVANYICSVDSNLTFYRINEIIVNQGRLTFDKTQVSKVTNEFPRITKVSAGIDQFVITGVDTNNAAKTLVIKGTNSRSLKEIPSAKISQVGTVEYDTGYVNINTPYITVFEYQSMLLGQLSSSGYLKFDETSPVTWK